MKALSQIRSKDGREYGVQWLGITSPNSSNESETASEEDAKQVPEIGMEQDVKTDWFVGKRFESYDILMVMIDDLKVHDHPLRVFNSQTALYKGQTALGTYRQEVTRFTVYIMVMASIEAKEWDQTRGTLP